ncbi:MAG: FkbM family methyltransferase [Pseudomonadota bacterium]
MQLEPPEGRTMSRDFYREPLADAVMDAKMREIWGQFKSRPRIQQQLRNFLPPSKVHVLGCDFIVNPRDNWTEFKMWRDGQMPEQAQTKMLCERMADRDVTVVDVGANAGAFSLPIMRVAGPGSRAVLFEPNPEMQFRLRNNIALNDIENIHIFDCAVSDKKDRATLHFPKHHNLGQARLDKEYADDAESIEVELRPLPDCLTEAGVTRIDFLKVDVEGLEDRVIGPLLESDTAPKPHLIYFEVAHKQHWTYPLTELLEDRGYRLAQDYNVNALYELDRIG